MTEVRSGLRVQESIDELDVLRHEIETWLAAVRADTLLSRYVTHWAALEQVLLPGLEKARVEMPAGDSSASSGAVYAACRRADLRAVFLRRLWRWYADRIDPRRGAEPEVEHTMEAADELVWSCWKPTFGAAGLAPPPPPLPFVDHRFTATATPRVTVPGDLAAARDELLAAQVTRLPVPVIGLPALVLRRPWWLILLAHETGHHVQHDLAATPGLVESVAQAVGGAATSAGADADEAGLWSGWSRELFADAYSAAMVGPAALWAVEELEHRPPAGLVRSPAGTYPPPLVRLAVLRACLSSLGAPAPEPAVAAAVVLKELDVAPTAPLAAAVAAQLERVKGVAAALLAVPLGHTAVGALGHGLGGWYARPDGQAHAWADELRRSQATARYTDDAARQCAAGGVLAWVGLGSAGEPDAAAIAGLAGALRDTLRQCQVPGTREGRPEVVPLDEARDRLLEALDDPRLAGDGDGDGGGTGRPAAGEGRP